MKNLKNGHWANSSCHSSNSNSVNCNFSEMGVGPFFVADGDFSSYEQKEDCERNNRFSQKRRNTTR